MKAKLIVSIDCEGKWGIADRGEIRLSVINSISLNSAYKKILSILLENKAVATFGFVSALCMDVDWLDFKINKNIENMSFGEYDWMSGAKKALKENNLEGWLEPQLIKMVIDSEQHICSHGGFHIPYNEELVDEKSIDYDLLAIQDLRDKFNLDLDCLIFPRNVIGFKSKLYHSGFKAYRDIDTREKDQSFKGKVQRVCNEVLSLDVSDLSSHSNVQIGGGVIKPLSSAKFLNAKIGIRKYIPAYITKRRIDFLLSHAVKNGLTLHLYTHPHNFIVDESMFEKLSYLYKEANKYVMAESLIIATMKDEMNEV